MKNRIERRLVTTISPHIREEILTFENITDGLFQQYSEDIIDFKNETVRKALIELGWTPPKETPKGICKYCGTNIKDCIGLCPKCYNKISEEDK